MVHGAVRGTSWTDDLPRCPHAGVAFRENCRYRSDGSESQEHALEDRHLSVCYGENTCLYAVFDGHDGSNAVDYVHGKFPAELLLERLPLAKEGDTKSVTAAIRSSFHAVEKEFFASIAEALARRADIQARLPPGISGYQIYVQFPQYADQLQEINETITGGSTVSLALLHRDKLYAANAGDSRCVLCTCNPESIKDALTQTGYLLPSWELLQVKQISTDHDTDNDDEIRRLASLGLNGEKIRREGRVGSHQNTRSIGDYSMKGGYKDFDIVSEATSEPLIAEPYLFEAGETSAEWLFMFLMSDGVYRAVEETFPGCDANQVIAQYISLEFRQASSVQAVADGALSRILRAHHKEYIAGNEERRQTCRKRDDCTLVVRRFLHALGEKDVGGTVQPVLPATDKVERHVSSSSSAGDTTPAVLNESASDGNLFLPITTQPSSSLLQGDTDKQDKETVVQSAEKDKEDDRAVEEGQEGQEVVNLHVSFAGVELPPEFPESVNQPS